MLRLFGRRDKFESGLKRSRESWFARISQIVQRPSLDESLWEEMEELLISADVGIVTTSRLIKQVKEKAEIEVLKDPSSVVDLLKQEIIGILSLDDSRVDACDYTGTSGTRVILVIGVNGVGKTTSVAKLAHYFKEQGNKVILAASDTFRAAAIDQLQAWGNKVDVDVVAHGPGGDPAAIAHDAFEAAKARGANVVLIDTAGRLHTSLNLMEEMKKITRVLSKLDPEAPHETILTLDATTGQNGLIQARSFSEALGCTGVFLSKLDGTSKGGIVVAIVQDLGLPVLFVGTGEAVDDMAPFEPFEFVEELFSPVH